MFKFWSEVMFKDEVNQVKLSSLERFLIVFSRLHENDEND